MVKIVFLFIILLSIAMLFVFLIKSITVIDYFINLKPKYKIIKISNKDIVITNANRRTAKVFLFFINRGRNKGKYKIEECAEE